MCRTKETKPSHRNYMNFKNSLNVVMAQIWYSQISAGPEIYFKGILKLGANYMSVGYTTVCHPSI